jgi:hypothetical protein
MSVSYGILLPGVKQYHTAKTISLNSVNFTSSTYVSLGGSASGGNSLNLMKAHGSYKFINSVVQLV